jgi:RES domain-containing protein
LSGTGAKLVGGRWNPAGKPVVYTAGSSALSLIEHLTHLSRSDLEISFQLILIETYNTPISFLEDHIDKLPPEWKKDKEVTQDFGKQWLEQQYSPILRVPSVHSPWEYNYLINPEHPDLDIEIVDEVYYVYDDRFIEKEK